MAALLSLTCDNSTLARIVCDKPELLASLAAAIRAHRSCRPLLHSACALVSCLAADARTRVPELIDAVKLALYHVRQEGKRAIALKLSARHALTTLEAVRGPLVM